MTNPRKLKVTLVKSLIGRLLAHQSCAASLGLRRIHQAVIVDDVPNVRGAINKIMYLLKVEEIS